MGRQKYNEKTRTELADIRYQRLKESRRGKTFPYLTDELYDDLNKKGYKRIELGRGEFFTHSVLFAKEKALALRAEGYFARVVSVSNKIRFTEYAVYAKKRKK
jgi:hypothetical protein